MKLIQNSDIYNVNSNSPFVFESKLPGSGTSVFARMTELATKYSAVNLAQGFPDFLPPVELFEYLNEAVNSGMNQYAPMPGYLPLREQLSRRLQLNYNFEADPVTEITITAGATQAIYTIISSIIKPGDKVLIFEPAYDSYGPSVIVNGGIPVFIKLKEPQFSIPWEELENTLRSHNIKLILINNPHNPCGTVLSSSDVDRLYSLGEKYDCILLWDEVYDLLVFDQIKHYSALQHELMPTRGIVVFSLGKTLHNTGWKMGYVVANSYYTSEIRKLHQFTVFSVNTPGQFAVAKFIENHFQFFNELPEFYQKKRDTFLNKIYNSGLEILPCSGSYFILTSIKKITNLSDEDFARQLATQCGVACVPISAFYHDQFDPGIVRFCFAKKEETLQLAGERLHNIISKFQFN
ncbi:MAG: aminotransferase class I/II-fold pyridoxal phosphate-dependent enzyme [Saprospiraceae bacterium]|nr:aminotransferase class I/II-fold pyridoxal phosphate-dependent enzyme [Saprospiraceae bacterium]